VGELPSSVTPRDPLNRSIEPQGFFKIHGAEHEVTMKVDVQVAADQIAAETHFVVPYAKWGMKNPSTFILRVSDTVAIDIHAAGRLTFSPENQ
jgi:hypothetical protein